MSGLYQWMSVLAAALLLSSPAASQRKVIRSEGDLPAILFSRGTSPSTALVDNAFVTETLPTLRKEALRVQTTYDIADSSIAMMLRAGLAAAALLDGRAHVAAAIVDEARATAAKPEDRVLGLLPLTLAVASSAHGGVDCEAGADRLSALLKASDPAVIHDTVLTRLFQVETTSATSLAELARSTIDPVAAGRGGMTLLEGLKIANWRVQALFLAPCRSAYAAVIRAWLKQPGTRQTNIWAAREPTPAMLAKAKSVVVAVWDGGVDTALFADQLASDPTEPLDGRDNDRNGIVDDWNGPTYDYRLRPYRASLVLPSATLASQLAFQMALAKGGTDLGNGHDTPEAAMYARRLREASPAEQHLDEELFGEIAYRDHGTAVASEIVAGAPFVRLYNVAALPFGREPQPITLDEGQIARWVDAIGRLGPRLRGASVRIVNMSWFANAQEIEESLLAAGLAADSAQANRRANALYHQVDAALRTLVAECPGILFVTGSGNTGGSAEALHGVPQSIVAPNVIVVGAAGVNGRPSTLTTVGANVALYAWGTNVPIVVPGGTRTQGSGTSYAAPQVARAAALMLAVQPGLAPADLKRGLVVTATAGDGGVKLLDMAAAARWAEVR